MRPSAPACSAVACRLLRIPVSGSPAGSMSALSVSRTGFGKPGSSTGGLIRDASGTASVSAATPLPAAAPGSGWPGM